jgi:hypothetical protein
VNRGAVDKLPGKLPDKRVEHGQTQPGRRATGDRGPCVAGDGILPPAIG